MSRVTCLPDLVPVCLVCPAVEQQVEHVPTAVVGGHVQRSRARTVCCLHLEHQVNLSAHTHTSLSVGCLYHTFLLYFQLTNFQISFFPFPSRIFLACRQSSLLANLWSLVLPVYLSQSLAWSTSEYSWSRCWTWRPPQLM